MGWANYDDALVQLRDYGLIPKMPLVIGTGKIQRCKVEGDHELRGWYSLHEYTNSSNELLIVGAYGIWRGNDNSARQIQLKKTSPLSDVERRAIKEKIAEDKKRANAMRKAEADRAARQAQKAWGKCSADGDADYLKRKAIGAHGVRFTPTGAVVIPMCDAVGNIHGLQFILSKTSHADRIKKTNRDKEYWPKGLAKQGHFHLIGGTPSGIVLIAEGYATAASLYQATGLPVVVAFDANNLQPVAIAIRQRYSGVKVLLCADDDYKTDKNPGVTAASAAALVVDGAWLAPVFSSERPTDKKGPTDFNDLHVLEGLHLVRSQVEARLRELGWRVGEALARGTSSGEMGESGSFRFDLDILLQNFSLIYSTETVFDGRRRIIIAMGALRAAAGKSLVRMWLEHPERNTVMPDQVGFDPTNQDANVVCNMWGGWPTVPRSGSCDRILELLDYLCSNEDEPFEVYKWLLKWIAYPIQNPGAKMQTALLMHGPEGTGKNTFFACVRAIYGKYGCQFSQTELESQFNGWASGKLFGIGNEVVTRVELYHQQGRLKNMITESEWMINEKNLPTRMEQNHCNFVFFSNRVDIAKLDREDRRYCVVWTPPAMSAEFYLEVADEIKNGGIEALHEYLVSLDLGTFDAHTKPPMTRSKRELIDISMDSTERFWMSWSSNELGIKCQPIKSQDLYDGYTHWARLMGIPKYAPQHVLLANIGKKNGVEKRQAKYMNGQGLKMATFIFPPGIREPPIPNQTQTSWLGDCVRETKESLELWRTKND